MTRLKVRAAIVRDDHILLVEYGAGWEPHFNLPGGSTEAGETLVEALRREVREETRAEIVIGRLLCVLDFNDHHPAYVPGTPPVLEFIFACTLADGSEPHLPDHPDPHQTAVRWLTVEQLPHIPLRPKIGAQLQALLLDRDQPDPFIENPPER